MATASPLYSTDILRLAVAAGLHGRLTSPDATAQGRTPVCGSSITLDLTLDDNGCIERIGMDLHACAMGQAAAQIFASGAIGRDHAALADAEQGLRGWLNTVQQGLPDWPGIEALAVVRAYPARHEAVLLPFRVGAQAASQAAEYRASMGNIRA